MVGSQDETYDPIFSDLRTLAERTGDIKTVLDLRGWRHTLIAVSATWFPARSSIAPITFNQRRIAPFRLSAIPFPRTFSALASCHSGAPSKEPQRSSALPAFRAADNGVNDDSPVAMSAYVRVPTALGSRRVWLRHRGWIFSTPAVSGTLSKGSTETRVLMLTAVKRRGGSCTPQEDLDDRGDVIAANCCLGASGEVLGEATVGAAVFDPLQHAPEVLARLGTKEMPMSFPAFNPISLVTSIAAR